MTTKTAAEKRRDHSMFLQPKTTARGGHEDEAAAAKAENVVVGPASQKQTFNKVGASLAETFHALLKLNEAFNEQKMNYLAFPKVLMPKDVEFENGIDAKERVVGVISESSSSVKPILTREALKAFNELFEADLRNLAHHFSFASRRSKPLRQLTGPHTLVYMGPALQELFTQANLGDLYGDLSETFTKAHLVAKSQIQSLFARVVKHGDSANPGNGTWIISDDAWKAVLRAPILKLKGELNTNPKVTANSIFTKQVKNVDRVLTTGKGKNADKQKENVPNYTLNEFNRNTVFLALLNMHIMTKADLEAAIEAGGDNVKEYNSALKRMGADNVRDGAVDDARAIMLASGKTEEEADAAINIGSEGTEEAADAAEAAEAAEESESE